MSDKESEFLKSWIDKNITYLDKGGDYVRAMELADKCRAAAEIHGIKIDETEGGIGVLETIIHKAMHYRGEAPSE
jgi:hypothetical protein